MINRSSRDEVPPGPGLGDTGAGEDFTVLFTRHADELHRYLARWVPMAADDLVADVFVSAIHSRTHFDATRGTARAWLFGIATNLLHTHLRGRRREREAYARLAPGHESDSHEGRVVDSVDAEVKARQFAVAVQQLKQRDRDVLLLTSWAGLDTTEVAQALDIPVGTVRSRLHRVRQQLRTACPAVVLESNDD
ncbi:RNA polymerase sigma factor [Lentzea sp. NBRC 102530]|uniref:RNA polymerase sigma factor n=1 Tax=Lentzea sp. NBRC 102530 TaxID=3032201 RepID=UPI0025566B9B|nr:RNA polymerase sigma factor [Lentzea sp. NBRC 102530]